MIYFTLYSHFYTQGAVFYSVYCMQENHDRVKYLMAINTFVPLAHVYVRDRDYSVYISMCTVTQHVHVFKYNEQHCTCEYEVFEELYYVQDYLEALLKGKHK